MKGSRITKNSPSLLHDGDEVAFGVAIQNTNGESHRRPARFVNERPAHHFIL